MNKELNSLDEIKDNIIIDYETYVKSQEKLYPDGLSVHKVLTAILNLQHDKEAVYGQSWRKYGNMSAFMNVARKWDRIDNIMRNAMENGMHIIFSEEAGTAQETFLDTVVDLASYSLLWVGYIANEHPDMWQRFLESNRLTQENPVK
jgi:hypothetical protein